MEKVSLKEKFSLFDETWTPKLVGDRIGLHPVIVIFAVAAGGQLFGFFGILLALPAAAVLSVLVRFAFNRYLKEHPEARVQIDLE